MVLKCVVFAQMQDFYLVEFPLVHLPVGRLAVFLLNGK